MNQALVDTVSNLSDLSHGLDVHLTQDDIDRLLRRARPETKLEVLDKVKSCYLADNLSAEDIKIAEQIILLLSKDAAVRIRSALAESLQKNNKVSKDIILQLAYDVEEVATPILSFSELLDEHDLLEVVQNCEEIWRYLAIAVRPALDEDVSSGLVETGHPAVVYKLLENQNAAISMPTYLTLVDNAEHDELLAIKLVERNLLPVTVAEKLMSLVSAEMCQKMRISYKIDTKIVEEEEYFINEQNIINLVNSKIDKDQLTYLIRRLHQNNRLNLSLLLRGLCGGNIEFFENGMAELANVPLNNAQKLVSDRGQLGFVALYERAGLPMGMFDSVRLLFNVVYRAKLDKISTAQPYYSEYIMDKIYKNYDENMHDNMVYILSLLEQQASV